ncbi:MAG: hypothetical protein EOP11_09265, partial [Proteobacteria bacterium]
MLSQKFSCLLAAACAALIGGPLTALAYDPYTDAGTYNVISKVEVRLPDGAKKFATLKTEFSYGKDPTTEIYSPYLEVENADGSTVIYPTVATKEMKAVLCELANGARVPRFETADPAPIGQLKKAAPVHALTYGADGFQVIGGQTVIASNVPCLKNKAENYTPMSPGQNLGNIEVVRKSDGALLKGELHGVGFSLNPFGKPFYVATPQVQIDGVAYDIWGGQGTATAQALCKVIEMDNVNSNAGYRVSADP